MESLGSIEIVVEHFFLVIVSTMHFAIFIAWA